MLSGRTAALLSAVIGLATVLSAGVAHAAPCKAFNLQSVNAAYNPLFPGSPGDVDTSDMTFKVMLASSPITANDCSGVYDGNNEGNATSKAQVPALIGALSWGTGYTGALTSNAVNGVGPVVSTTAHGITWGLSYNATPGQWVLSYAANPDVTKMVDLVLVMKQSQGWAAFWFDNVIFNTDNAGTGTFYVDWCTGQPSATRSNFAGCGATGLSHLSAYFGDPRDPPFPCTGPNCDPREVPLPGTLALLGAAAIGVGAVRRRATRRR